MAVPEVKQPHSVTINKNARVFIRNLPFSADESLLRATFGKYGKILDVHLPQKNGSPAGFGFVNFQSVNSVDMACRHLHETLLNGRKIYVSPALAKQFYDQKRFIDATKNQLTSRTHAGEDGNEPSDAIEPVEATSADNEIHGNVVRLSKARLVENFTNSDQNSLKRKQRHISGAQRSDDEECCSDDECNRTGTVDSAYDEEDNSQSTATEERELPRKPSSATTNVSKTLFVRNVPFDATPEDLQHAFEQYGEIEFAIPCKDRATGIPRGTAFVRFCRVKHMEAALAAADPRTGILESTDSEMSGRKLMICHAVARDKLQAVVAANPAVDKSKKAEDKRNLYLINVGTVMRNSDDIEGVSAGDMKKRDMLQQRKKQALKNLHVFISPTRLSVHNLPKSCTDARLRSILMDAVKGEHGVQLKECRVMRDLKRLDTDGKPVSKGFGFAEFGSHEHAMKALLAVNNNPNIFGAERRPIVEFSLEDRNALLKRKRRTINSQLRLGQLNEIKVKQKFGLPLNTNDHATLAGKTLVKPDNKKQLAAGKAGKKQHLNRKGNRGGGAPGWNKPNPNKKRSKNNSQTQGGDADD